MARKWLVTGAAGFIGSNVCTDLLGRGCRVVGIDNFSTGKRQNSDRLSAGHSDLFEFVEGDIRDRDAMEKVLQGVDVVVHLAAQVSVQKSIDDPLDTDLTNVNGTLNVLDIAGKFGVGTFIYASSCAVYGNNEALPLSETEIPEPMSPYAVSKLSNEHYAGVVTSLYPPMTTTGLRFFNIFGPWQDPSGGYAAVIPKWIDLCLSDTQPVMYGDGSATRDFCCVGNVAEAIWQIAEQAEPLPHGVYNIGTSVSTSLNELFDGIVSALSSRDVRLTFNGPDRKPWKTGDILHSYSDVSRARNDFGFNPKISLSDGIDLLLATEYNR